MHPNYKHERKANKTIIHNYIYIYIDSKPSDGEVPEMLWGMWSTLSLPLLPGPQWPRVVALNSLK